MDSASTPLADYFWIAGIELASLKDPSPAQPTNQLENTISEDAEADESEASPQAGTARASARHSRHNSTNRLSKISNSDRLSFQALEELDVGTRSNRSSTTIRPSQLNGTGQAGGESTSAFGQDFDFDTALIKFAVEREKFLEDLTFSAGAKLESRPPMVNPRTERLKGADGEQSGRMSPLRSIRGSIRRKISFRELSSARKQPTVPRPASIRTAKRLSNYNSVIPPPEPLNTDPDMHPLKRRFEPTLLDRYPPRSDADEIARRGKFPDYVPMFAFPNDIQIVSSDDRPRSTWHGFTMTSEDNTKLYGITVIVWTALPASVAEDVERRCEEWRQRHMTNEERELAASLGSRLASERAHLSQLLAKLPMLPSGSAAREVVDDQISAVEEKIGLMTEMLRPLRHGAASKIDGLTAGESGLWVPRAYGVLGRDPTKISFWKEWLRAVIVPMTDGAVLRVPASSPKVGRWQPLERYVVNLCTEAFSPIGSKTQVELGIRELRLYARKEAANEIPGSRNVDIYALFRCLSLEHIVDLFEYAMSESRIVFLSSHTAMLHLACHALASLLYPFKWASIFIPVLPARLISALDAPCPYMVGIERRYEKIELPEDDYVLVDLDKDTVDGTAPPVRLPRQHRRKLLSLLQLAAPHQLRFGVASGPPPYAMETYPYDAVSAENHSLFTPTPAKATLGKWVTQNSSTFGDHDFSEVPRIPVFNAFLVGKMDQSRPDRPATSRSNKTSPPSSVSPISPGFPPLPTTPISRSESGLAGNNHVLREKRSGHFDDRPRRSSSFGMDRHPPPQRSNLQFLNGHAASLSVSAISVDSHSSYGGGGSTGAGPGYAPSTYAPSTMAASTVMPNMLVQPVKNTETTVWVEGHCFKLQRDFSAACHICDERADVDGSIYRCNGCGTLSHGRCLGFVSLVCPIAFHADRVRAAFVRCMASLLYTYRKHLGRPTRDRKTAGQLYSFDMDGFIKGLPFDQQAYANMMRETQAFNEFIHERECHPATHPSIRLFDEIILAKKARGRSGLPGISRISTIKSSHSTSSTSSSSFSHPPPPKPNKIPAYLADTSDHLWVTASVPVPAAKFPGDYHAVVTRVPAALDPSLMKEPRAIQGIPRPPEFARGRGGGAPGLARKQVPRMVTPTGPAQVSATTNGSASPGSES